MIAINELVPTFGYPLATPAELFNASYHKIKYILKITQIY